MGTKLIAPLPRKKTHPRWMRYVSGQRLGLFAIILLMLFFAISSYVGSARNHKLLAQANNERSVLIVSQGQLTDMTSTELRYIQQLLKTLDDQNQALKKAGQKIIVIPPSPGKPYAVTVPTPSPTP